MLITQILPQPKEILLILVHSCIPLLELMKFISMDRTILWIKKFLPKPLLKDIPSEIFYTNLELILLNVPRNRCVVP